MGDTQLSKPHSSRRKPTKITIRRSNGHGNGIVPPVNPIMMGHTASVCTSLTVAPDFTEPRPKPESGVWADHPAAAHVKILDRDKGIVETMRKKVAIVGYAETSRMLAPFDDPEWEIWGMNQLYRHIPREDRHFEIHHNWNEHVVEGTDHVGWLANSPIPTYMVTRVPEIPNSVTLPIQRLIDINGKDYFGSSIAYMIAMAIAEGFTHLHIYGVDLIVGDEWDYQKPNAEFWIGVASGKGMFVGIPPESALTKQTWRYGYQSQPDSLVRMSEIHDRRQYLMAKRHEALIAVANWDGALQDCEMFNELATLRVRGSNVQLKPGK